MFPALKPVNSQFAAYQSKEMKVGDGVTLSRLECRLKLLDQRRMPWSS